MDLRRACGCVVLLFAVSVVGPEGRSAPRVLDVRSLVRNVANFTDADWAAVENGAPVAKVLETDAREVAIAGAVRIAAPRERLVARLRDVDHLKRSAVVLDVGRFRRPPAASDLSNVPFEDYSLDLRDCQSGDCRVRLTSADIESFHHAIDWRSSDWRTRAAAVWRDVLAHHAATYSELGRKGLPVYVNRADPLNVASELSVLAGSFAFVAAGTRRSSTPISRSSARPDPPEPRKPSTGRKRISASGRCCAFPTRSCSRGQAADHPSSSPRTRSMPTTTSMPRSA